MVDAADSEIMELDRHFLIRPAQII